MPPAGTVIPEYITNKYNCRTWASGWLNGKHPEHAGITEEASVCYSWKDSNDNFDNVCHHHSSISITHCGLYYVYKLPTVPNCIQRYCAVN